MRSQNQAGSLAREKLANGFDLGLRRLLLGNQVVQPEHHQGVGVGKHTLVQRQSLAGLIDPLVHRDGLPGGLADHVLKADDRQMEQLQRSGDPL